MSERPILVTGAGGFVGGYLMTALRDREIRAAIISSGRGHGAGPHPHQVLDVTDLDAVTQAVQRLRPSHIVHLAGIAAPADATVHPQQAWSVHVRGTSNLINAIMKYSPDTYLIHVSSGLVYGASLAPPIGATEDLIPTPIGSYAITKAAADEMVGALSSGSLNCIRLRPFNHIGPGQSSRFAVSNFAMQVAKIEAKIIAPVLRVGNLTAVRDFLDVRDVVAAYALIVERSGALASGTVLNVASGVPRTIGDILQQLIEIAGVKVEIVQDPALVRHEDVPWLVGDAGRLERLTGWRPRYSLARSLEDILSCCRECLGVQGNGS